MLSRMKAAANVAVNPARRIRIDFDLLRGWMSVGSAASFTMRSCKRADFGIFAVICSAVTAAMNWFVAATVSLVASAESPAACRQRQQRRRAGVDGRRNRCGGDGKLAVRDVLGLQEPACLQPADDGITGRQRRVVVDEGWEAVGLSRRAQRSPQLRVVRLGERERRPVRPDLGAPILESRGRDVDVRTGRAPTRD